MTVEGLAVSPFSDSRLLHDKLVFGVCRRPPVQVSDEDSPVEVTVEQIVGHTHQVFDAGVKPTLAPCRKISEVNSEF